MSSTVIRWIASEEQNGYWETLFSTVIFASRLQDCRCKHAILKNTPCAEQSSPSVRHRPPRAIPVLRVLQGVLCFSNLLMPWSGRPDSNWRPSAPKADALPDCATPRRDFTRCCFDFNPIRACVSAPCARLPRTTPDATIEKAHGGYSSEAERLTVAQDVVGSIPTSRPRHTLRVGILPSVYSLI